MVHPPHTIIEFIQFKTSNDTDTCISDSFWCVKWVQFEKVRMFCFKLNITKYLQLISQVELILPCTFTRAKSLASMTVPWKNSTWVKCLFSKPSNSRSGRILQRVEPKSIHVSVCVLNHQIHVYTLSITTTPLLLWVYSFNDQNSSGFDLIARFSKVFIGLVKIKA